MNHVASVSLWNLIENIESMILTQLLNGEASKSLEPWARIKSHTNA